LCSTGSPAFTSAALAGFEFARGGILRFHHIVIAEGPLPGCALERAVEHQRERTRAVVLRERDLPDPHPLRLPEGQPRPAAPPGRRRPSLPALYRDLPNPHDGITGNSPCGS
jgi:hypothetical protein